MLIKKEIKGTIKENKIMRKGIIIGIGILILLLALAGTGSAKSGYSGVNCSKCHSGGDFSLTVTGNYYKSTHKFDGNAVASASTSCTTCHTNLTTAFLPLTSNGSIYNSTHRYNATTLASVKLAAPACANCHVNVVNGDFNLSTGTPTYLTSSVCEACHRAKYDNWTNTLHRVMLTPKDKAQAMNLPTPEVGWPNISYVIVTKFQFAYINTTGYFLAKNDEYNTETKTWVNSSHAGGRYGTCGNCHTTGWNTTGFNYSLLNGILPGFNATSFSEPGIACERCHKPAGNGHQVVINYSGDQCRECHTGNNHGTGWENGEHAPPPYENGSNCMFCHSSFDQYKNPNVTIANATGVSCGVCHNIHDMTDGKYASTFTVGNFAVDTWSVVADAKLSFFNATASIAAGTDIFDNLLNTLLYPGTDSNRKDSSYGTAPINLTGRPVSEVLCSTCHYRHGLAHTAGVNLSHGLLEGGATCTDCHMSGANATVGKDMMKQHANDPLTPNSCGGTTKCHTTSAQNLSASEYSVIPVINEWKATAHNDKEVSLPNATGVRNPNSSFYRSINGTTGNVTIASRQNSCLKCHSPIDWNPATDSNTTSVQLSAGFNGITCAVCHNIHDMGDWLAKTKAAFGVEKAYAWYNKDAIVANTTTGLPSRYKANYTMMESTTELCGNCHSNVRNGNTGPGWALGSNNPTGVHGFPAKDIFVGSWKQSGILKFECIDCHMYFNKTNATGAILSDANKSTGHSFAVNAQGLQNTTNCSGCHVNGTSVGSIEDVITKIQADTHAKWNSTNLTVQNALTAVRNYKGLNASSRDKVALAYWKLRNVYSDESWGVHDPAGTMKLLNDAATLANDSVASLGQATSSVDLVMGWNLVALIGTPSVTAPVSVLSSVSSNITVVWGYNATSNAWELYDPAMPTQLNTLNTIVPGKGYWINAIKACKWTV